KRDSRTRRTSSRAVRSATAWRMFAALSPMLEPSPIKASDDARRCLSPAEPISPTDPGTSVIFYVGEALIGGRAFEHVAFLRGLPGNDLFDLLRQFEVFVGDAFRRMGDEAHLDPGVGRGNVRVMPGRLCEMADGRNHHHRAFPARGLVGAANPPVLQTPLGQVFG